MIYCWSVISWRFCYVWICDQDSTREREPYYLESAIKSRCLLPGQHFLRGTTAKSGKPNRVLYAIHQKKSLLETCRCVCRQCLRTSYEKPARIPKDAERLLERKHSQPLSLKKESIKFQLTMIFFLFLAAKRLRFILKISCTA